MDTLEMIKILQLCKFKLILFCLPYNLEILLAIFQEDNPKEVSKYYLYVQVYSLCLLNKE